MNIKRNYLEAWAFIIVYLFAIYLWTLPFQANRVPYGEWDAISHWEIGDFIAQRDRTFVSLPPFLDYSYATDNKFKPHTLWYHPQFHTDLAIISAFSNDRMVPIYLTNAIFASSILISAFFVIRRLFGFLPAILSSFMLAFSMWDILPYLWGQWPERFAYAFIPLILYCFYMYYTTYSKEKSKPIYLYIMSLLLVIDVFIHPLVFFHSLVGLFVLGAFLAIKERKMPFNLKHLSMAFLVFLILFAAFPYQSGNVLVSFAKSSTPEESKYPMLSRLLQWGPNPGDFVGSVPASYFSFEQMIGYWGFLDRNKMQGVNSNSPLFKKLSVNITNLIFIFLALGLIFLALRRESKDLLLLAWLVSLYLILHRDLIGKFMFLHRSLSASAHIFMPLIAIGALSMPSLIKLPKLYRAFLKYGIAILIVVLALINNLPHTYSILNQAYQSPLSRLNSAQIEVSEWLKDNIPEGQNVSVIGPFQDIEINGNFIPTIMQKVWWMASYSHRTSYFFEGFLAWPQYEENKEEVAKYHLLNDYIVFDYTDISLLSESLVQQWQAFESQNMQNHALLYNKGNIRVYKYENA